jgi:hypothetical protein
MGVFLYCNVVLVQRELENSGIEISYSFGNLYRVKEKVHVSQPPPSALRFARLLCCVEPPHQIPPASESAAALSAAES